MSEEEGGILSFLDKVVDVETICQPVIGESTPKDWYDEALGEKLYAEAQLRKQDHPDGVVEGETDDRPRDYQEKRFESYLCEYLTKKGYQYERQKRCANGIIDIFVYDKIPWIIEVKRSATPFYLIQGIAQLKFYARCFSASQLYIATPEQIKEEHHSILKEFNIGRWCGND